MNWNPETRSYCKDCPHYNPVGTYIYQLEADPRKRKCQYLKICGHVVKKTTGETSKK